MMKSSTRILTQYEKLSFGFGLPQIQSLSEIKPRPIHLSANARKSKDQSQSKSIFIKVEPKIPLTAPNQVPKVMCSFM